MEKPTVSIQTLLGDGTDAGVLDSILAKIETTIEGQWSKGYMSGPEYSQVLLGSIQSALSEGITFALSMDKATQEAQLLEKQNATELMQLALLKEQIEQAKVQKKILEAQLLGQLEQNKLLTLQQTKVTAETSHQIKETELLDLRELMMQREYETMALQQAHLTAETDHQLKETELLTLQKTKLSEDIAAVTAQIALMSSQKQKVDADKALSAQKLITEQANTQSGIASPDSLVGKQVGLLGAQTEGFYRDAEQKATKMLLDTFNVRASQGEAIPTVDNKLMDTNIGQFITKLASGINVSLN